MSFMFPKSKIKTFFKKVFKPIVFIWKKVKLVSKPVAKYTKKRTRNDFWELLGLIAVIVTLLLIPFELSRLFALLFIGGLALWSGLRAKNKYLKQMAYFLAIMFFVMSMGSFFFYSQAWIPGKTILFTFLFILSISVGLNYTYIKGYYTCRKMIAKRKESEEPPKAEPKESKKTKTEKKKTLKTKGK